MKPDPKQVEADKSLIESLGGATRVAERMGFSKEKGGPQRVQNWTKRGIPPEIKLARPDLFLPQFKVKKQLEVH